MYDFNSAFDFLVIIPIYLLIIKHGMLCECLHVCDYDICFFPVPLLTVKLNVQQINSCLVSNEL